MLTNAFWAVSKSSRAFWAISLSHVSFELRDWLTRSLLGSLRRNSVTTLSATVRTVLKPRRRFRWATIHSLHVVISIFCALILSRSLLVQCSQNSLSSGVGRGVGTGAALPPCPPDLFFLPRCFTWSTTILCCPDSPNLSELHQCPNNFKTVQMVLSLSGWF